MNTQTLSPVRTVSADFRFSLSMAGHAARVHQARISESYYAALDAMQPTEAVDTQASLDTEHRALEAALTLVYAASASEGFKGVCLFTDAQARRVIEHFPLTAKDDADFEAHHRTPGFPPFGYTATQVRAIDLCRYLKAKRSAERAARKAERRLSLARVG